MNTKLNIVIPCYKAGKTIKKCIDAILCSDINYKYVITVVDDGANPDLDLLLRNYNINIIKSLRQSPAIARNKGAFSVDSEITVFIDSDVLICKDTVNKLVEPIVNGSTNATIGSYITNFNGLNFYQKYKLIYLKKTYSRKKGSLNNFFWTAICAIDSKTFRDLNGFSENLPECVCEDKEFGQRLSKNNYTIKIVSDANGYHLKSFCLKSLLLNDIKKGTNAIYVKLKTSTPVTYDPHAGLTDIVSALLAVPLLAEILVSPFYANEITLLLAIALNLLLYSFMRFEYLKLMSQLGIIFLIKSFFLMFVLDNIRVFCVINGIIKYLKLSYKSYGIIVRW